MFHLRPGSILYIPSGDKVANQPVAHIAVVKQLGDVSGYYSVYEISGNSKHTVEIKVKHVSSLPLDTEVLHITDDNCAIGNRVAEVMEEFKTNAKIKWSFVGLAKAIIKTCNIANEEKLGKILAPLLARLEKHKASSRKESPIELVCSTFAIFAYLVALDQLGLSLTEYFPMNPEGCLPRTMRDILEKNEHWVVYPLKTIIVTMNIFSNNLNYVLGHWKEDATTFSFKDTPETKNMKGLYAKYNTEDMDTLLYTQGTYIKPEKTQTYDTKRSRVIPAVYEVGTGKLIARGVVIYLQGS